MNVQQIKETIENLGATRARCLSCRGGASHRRDSGPDGARASDRSLVRIAGRTGQEHSFPSLLPRPHADADRSTDAHNPRDGEEPAAARPLATSGAARCRARGAPRGLAECADPLDLDGRTDRGHEDDLGGTRARGLRAPHRERGSVPCFVERRRAAASTRGERGGGARERVLVDGRVLRLTLRSPARPHW